MLIFLHIRKPYNTRIHPQTETGPLLSLGGQPIRPWSDASPGKFQKPVTSSLTLPEDFSPPWLVGGKPKPGQDDPRDGLTYGNCMALLPSGALAADTPPGISPLLRCFLRGSVRHPPGGGHRPRIQICGNSLCEVDSSEPPKDVKANSSSRRGAGKGLTNRRKNMS